MKSRMMAAGRPITPNAHRYSLHTAHSTAIQQARERRQAGWFFIMPKRTQLQSTHSTAEIGEEKGGEYKGLFVLDGVSIAGMFHVCWWSVVSGVCLLVGGMCGMVSIQMGGVA